MTKRALGKDVFKEKPLSAGRKTIEEELRPKGQVKVSLLLTSEDVESVERLQLLLSQRGYGKYTKSDIVRMGIRKLHVDDFAKRSEG